MKVKHGIMERGFHSRVFGRTGLSRPSILRCLDQKEPFDLSQKRRAKQEACRSDGESAKGSPCQEEEETSGLSHGMYHAKDKLPMPEDMSNKPGYSSATFLNSDCEEKKEILTVEKGPEVNERGDDEGDENQRELSEKQESRSFRQVLNKRRTNFSANYLSYKHRKESFKQLLKRKMQHGRQAVKIGV